MRLSSDQFRDYVDPNDTPLEERPMRLSDMTPTHQRMLTALMEEKHAKVAQEAIASGDPKLVAALNPGGGLIAGASTPEDRAANIYTRMARAAQPANLLPPGHAGVPEHLAGEGFYFDHARRLLVPTRLFSSVGGSSMRRTISPEGTAAGEFRLITGATSRLSPRNDPISESRTASGLYRAVTDPNAVVNFHPDLVRQLHDTWNASLMTAKGQRPPSNDPGERHWVGVPAQINAHAGRTMHVSEIHPAVMDLMSHRSARDVTEQHTARPSDVDWADIGATGIGAHRKEANRIFQGEFASLPHQHLNPKQTGYAESTYHAAVHPVGWDPIVGNITPDMVEAEYRHHSEIVGAMFSGRMRPGDEIPNPHNMHHINLGMLSNRAYIASDVWTKGALAGYGQPIANRVGDAPLSTITLPIESAVGQEAVRAGFNKRGSRVSLKHPDNPLTALIDKSTQPLEHALDQRAVEMVADKIQRDYNLPFSVPTRLIQETGGWGQPRREIGKDPEFALITGGGRKRR